jgi:hypothetical protein
MSSLLIHQAQCIASQNDAGTEWRNASIWVRDGRIEAIVNAADVPTEWLHNADEVIERVTDEFVTGMADLDRLEAQVRTALNSLESLR